MTKKEMFRKCFINIKKKRPPNVKGFWVGIWHPTREQLLYCEASKIVEGYKELKASLKLRKQIKKIIKEDNNKYIDNNLHYFTEYWMYITAPEGKKVNKVFNLKTQKRLNEKMKIIGKKKTKKKKRKTLL